MKSNIHVLDIDIKHPTYINEPQIKQNDSVVFTINITDNGDPYDLSKVATITLAAKRSDRIVVISPGVKTEFNQVTFKLPRSAVSQVGKADATVQMYDASGRVSTLSFTFKVDKDPAGDDWTPSDGEKTLIEVVLGDGPVILANAEQATIYANEQGDYAKEEADKLAALNDVVTTDEAVRIANEIDRQANEETRSTNETDRVSAESERLLNEESRNANEVLRESAEATRISQELQRQADTSQIITDATAATESANLSAGNADEKAQLAQDKIDELSGLNTEIGEVISNAETATGLAESAALEAGANAALATEASAYALAQGKRAEDAADAIDGALEDGTVLSVNGQTGIVNLSADDVGAATKQYVDDKINDHVKEKIHQSEVHGMRINDESFEYFDGVEWVELKGGAGEISVASIENLTAASSADGKNINLDWTLPINPEFERVEVYSSTVDLGGAKTDYIIANADLIVNSPTAASFVFSTSHGQLTYFYAFAIHSIFGAERYSEKVSASALAVDSLPPAPITQFKAESGNAVVDLSWTNPTDVDLSKVMIVKKLSGYPTSLNDGEIVYQGLGASVHLDGLENHVELFFRGFTEDAAGNINDAASQQVSVTPVDFVPDDPSGSPGSDVLIAGDMQAGYFGTVPASELFTGTQLSAAVGISAGTIQHDATDWLKFAFEGKILFRPMKAIRHTISWDNINAAGCVFGTKVVKKNGLDFKVRLMKGALTDPSKFTDPDRGAKCSEWNKLMLPIHEQAAGKNWAYPAYVEDDVPDWGIGFTDEDLLTHNTHGNGSYSWCQETRADNSAHRVIRGTIGVSSSSATSSAHALANYGWAPVLELSSL